MYAQIECAPTITMNKARDKRLGERHTHLMEAIFHIGLVTFGVVMGLFGIACLVALAQSPYRSTPKK